MRVLFVLDKENYDSDKTIFARPSMRAIIIKDNKIAMIHSLKNDYYKFPGGGAIPNETPQETLIREVNEESGLVVIASSIKEYGMVHRIEKGKYEDIFIQDNYYYLCDTMDEIKSQNLDDYEHDAMFTLEFVTAHEAIEVNSLYINKDKVVNSSNETMIIRETKVLKLLLEEGLVK